jgi:magnesium-transporting ATPase (P-type)
MEQNYNQPQIPLPNATAVMVLGILSIPFCCCYGIGLVFAIIALIMAKSSSKQYLAEPGKFLESSYSNLKTGSICAWIGLIISIIYIILLIVYLTVFLTNPLFQEQMQEIMKQYQF